MEVRIGMTLSGLVVSFDTAHERPVLLVGDVGRGKTTVARLLTRWWVADTNRHVHVVASTPSEWTDLDDLPTRAADYQPWPAWKPACTMSTCLVVVDDLDDLDNTQFSGLPWSNSQLVLTSHGGTALADRPRLEEDVDCLGLVQHAGCGSAELAVLEGQTRLDWPSTTVPVIPDQRGAVDLPRHRWRAPVPSWLAVAQ